MNLFFRMTLFVILFTVLFFVVRETNIIDIKTLYDNIGSVPWLYSTIGLIFGVTSAFIIQSGWNNWDSLVNSVKEEVSSIRRLVHFTKHVPKNFSERIEFSIKLYLKAVIEDWYEIGRSQKEENALQNLQEEMYLLFEKTDYSSQIGYSLMTNIFRTRDDRIHYSSREFPRMLKILTVFSTFLLIILSLFIGVKNIFLDYVFTLSIGVLAYLILEVINDLSSPLTPGSWHITNKRYEKLLKEMK